MKSHPFPSGRIAHQRGVVLIIALVMLVVISLLATFSIRNALSSESVSGNVRTTQLATESAEIALRFCENAVTQFVRDPVANPLPTGSSTLTISTVTVPPLGVNTANWDGARNGVYTLPLTNVNRASGSSTFNRAPECVVERVEVVKSTGVLTNTTTYLITARGFGPEVAATTTRPEGSEVWLQSTLEVE